MLQDIQHRVDGETFLSDINLRFEEGAFNVLLGRTLAGKTSLMRVIAGLDKPSSGSIHLNGKDITALPVQKRNVSMVYQQFINYPHLSVFDNIASPLVVSGMKANEINQRVKSTAELLQITPFLDKLPLALSGGQQQRCAMARAMVKDADIILFDEPLVNLDYKLREELRDELKRLFKQRECIALYATTEAHEALALGGTTSLLHQGQVLQSGPALEQYYQPVSLHAADLFHEPPLNQFHAQVQDSSLSLNNTPHFDDSAHLNRLANGSYIFAIRPDHLSLESLDANSMTVLTRVDLAEISASETYIHVTLVDSQWAGNTWIAHVKGIHPYHIGTMLNLHFSLNNLYVFTDQGQAVASPNMKPLVAMEAS